MFELEKAPKNVTYKCYLLRIGYLYRGMISNKGYFSTDIVNIFGDNHGYKENDKVCWGMTHSLNGTSVHDKEWGSVWLRFWKLFSLL